ncbi:MAG: STAS domain-containing protein [Phycisphaerales bacterium]|nr:STAS domain-containing protein [Phycisphaerales bacterium]
MLSIEFDQPDPKNPAAPMTVRLIGEASLAEEGILERAALRISAAHPKLVLLDFKHLRFLASLAMSELVQIHHAVSAHGGRVVIVGAAGVVRDALHRSKLHQILPLYETAQEALQAHQPA